MREETESMRLFLDNVRGITPTAVKAYLKRLAKESELGDEEFKDIDSLLDRVEHMEPLVLRAFISNLIHRRREQQQQEVEQEETLTKTEIENLIDSKIKEALSKTRQEIKESIPIKKVEIPSPKPWSKANHIPDFVNDLTVLETVRLIHGTIVPVKDEVQYTHCWIPDLSITLEEAEAFEKKYPGDIKELVVNKLNETFVHYSPQVNIVVGYPYYSELYSQFILNLRNKSEENYLNKPQYRLDKYKVCLTLFGGKAEFEFLFPKAKTGDFGDYDHLFFSNHDKILKFYAQTVLKTDITLET